MRSTGYRSLHTGCLYRPYRRPFFGSSLRTRASRALHLMVWTDEPPRAGACLSLDVFMADGSTLPTLADVIWVEPQPEGACAKYRVGLAVFPPNEAGLHSLEQLVVDGDAAPPSPPASKRPHEERADAPRVVVEEHRREPEGLRPPRRGDEAPAEEVPR